VANTTSPFFVASHHARAPSTHRERVVTFLVCREAPARPWRRHTRAVRRWWTWKRCARAETRPSSAPSKPGYVSCRCRTNKRTAMAHMHRHLDSNVLCRDVRWTIGSTRATTKTKTTTTWTTRNGRTMATVGTRDATKDTHHARRSHTNGSSSHEVRQGRCRSRWRAERLASVKGKESGVLPGVVQVPNTPCY